MNHDRGPAIELDRVPKTITLADRAPQRRKVPDRNFNFREVPFTPQTSLRSLELIELYRSIELTRGPAEDMIVQFVSGQRDEGAGQIALDMAWAAASILRRRVLVLDGTPANRASLVPPSLSTGTSVTEAALGMIDAEDAIVKISGIDMYVGQLRAEQAEIDVLGVTTQLARLLEQLRTVFDMTVIVPPSTSEDALAVMMARHVDGSVLVVEADRTRGRDAEKLKELITRAGSPVLGAVLNKHREYLPRWLRRWL